MSVVCTDQSGVQFMLDSLPYCNSILLIKICFYHFSARFCLYLTILRQVDFGFKAIFYPIVSTVYVELDSRLNMKIMQILLSSDCQRQKNNYSGICAYH